MIAPGALLFSWVVVVCFASATMERAAEIEQEAFIGPPTEETVNRLMAEAQNDREIDAAVEKAVTEGAISFAAGFVGGFTESVGQELFSGH